jgi:Peptidase family M1 domain
MVRLELDGRAAAQVSVGLGLLGALVAAGVARADEVPAPAPSNAVGVLKTPDSVLEVASYTLNARLDEAARTVHGAGTLTWVNTATVATSELYFHLYLNAFQNAQTLFNRSPFTRGRSGHTTRHWGRLELTRLVVRELGGADLLGSLASHSPDDLLDATDLRLPLPRPIEPGEVLTIELAWDSVLPDIVERTGVSRDFYFVGQWFPKLARLERDGSWAHFAFHPQAEFYSDFGDYDVTIDVPESMVVGATGTRVSEVVAEGRRTLRQRAQGVHDFAWTAWSAFERRDEHIAGVDVHLLFPPGNGLNAERTLEALRFALPHFDDRYGPYPYADLTVVHPPDHAAAAGGMEYPTLITTGGPWHQPYWSRAVELVTIHELGHQWFYGLVATNEPAWPFLDEGLNSYAESVASEAMFGAASAGSVGGLVLSATSLHRAGMQLGPHDSPIARPASQFVDFAELGGLVYSRTALLLRTIANVYGPEKLEQALRRYTARYRFEHPGPEELMGTLEEELGAAAAANVRGALFEGQGVNYSVRDLRSVRRSDGGGGPAPEAAGGAGDAVLGRFESRALIHRHGDLQFPVRVVLVTRDGERVNRSWDGAGRDAVISYVGNEPVVSARVDPDDEILIDENLLDNSLRSDPPAPLATWERAVYAFQLLLGWVGP